MGQVVLSVPAVTVSAPRAAGIGDLSQTVRSQLTSALASCRNFLVADRESLPEIAQEHQLSESGSVAPGEQAVPGQLIGARYLVKVDVTELEERSLGKSGGGLIEIGKLMGVLDLFGLSDKAKLASDVVKAADPKLGVGSETIDGLVGMELRVVDLDTGVVVATTRAQASLRRENSKTVLGIGGLSTSSDAFSKSVIGHATRAAAEQAVIKLHEAMRGVVARAASPNPTAVARKAP
ncbi:MAG: hypothetical protein KF678_15530 [Phycisphaeraceae bacterium]|nr:hypothetical protein [Phycisphaeraceae bacterium]